ncbi:MAG: shikimate kinase [Oscillibacter sp.]|nr:shikimate kinase [Oscillibacter sp.]
MRNVVLIGLPGGGMTAVGKAAAKLLHRPFFDSDAMGEKEDQQTLARLRAEKDGVVIALGSDAVLRSELMELLRRDGLLFFLDRNTGKAGTADQTGGAPAADKQRAKLCRRYADVTLTGGTVPELAETVVTMMEMQGEEP